MKEELLRLAELISDDDCAICGRSRSQHHTGSGYAMCQTYPLFESNRKMFVRLVTSVKEQNNGK